MMRLNSPDEVVEQLVDLTGPRKNPSRPGLTFSDLRSRLLPEALAHAFPARVLAADDLLRAAKELTPSPEVGAR